MAHLRLSVLQGLDLFSVLPAADLERLAQAAIEKRYEPGDVLFLEGQPCQGLWIIADGAANIVKTTPLGRQLVIATQTGVSPVGEVPVFDGGPYPASVIAVRPTLALLVLKDDLLALCRLHPALPLRFLGAFGRRLRHLVTLAERLTFGSIRQRLAAELLHLSEQAGALEFTMPETQEQLAQRLGTVREVVSRNLNRFESEGFLKVDRRLVAIHNAKALKQEAETEF